MSTISTNNAGMMVKMKTTVMNLVFCGTPVPKTTKDEEKEILSSTSTQQCRTEDGVMMVDGHVWEPRLS